MKKTRKSAKPVSADAIARLPIGARTCPILSRAKPDGPAHSARQLDVTASMLENWTRLLKTST